MLNSTPEPLPFFPFQKNQNRNPEPHPDVQRTARVDHRILSQSIDLRLSWMVNQMGADPFNLQIENTVQRIIFHQFFTCLKGLGGKSPTSKEDKKISEPNSR